MNSMFKYAIGLSVATLLGGVVAHPAQALTGTLGFSDGSDDWFSEVNPGANDTFDVLFNPFGLNFVTTATGIFAPPLFQPPLANVASSTGEFEYVSMNDSSFIYELTNDLVFAFNNGATVTWEAGSLVEGVFNNPDSVQFSFVEPSVTVTGIGVNAIVIDSTFQFSDTSTLGGGTYNAQVNAVVPEPLTIFGAGTAIAFGTGFKRKLGKAKKK